MESASDEAQATHPSKAPEVPTQSAVDADNTVGSEPSKLSTSGLSTWAKSLKIPDLSGKQDSTAEKSPFARFTSGLGLRLSPKAPQTNDNSEGTSPSAQSNFIGTLTKGLVDSSKSAVKAVQVKARHVVSQNKRRYQVPCIHTHSKKLAYILKKVFGIQVYCSLLAFYCDCKMFH